MKLKWFLLLFLFVAIPVGATLVVARAATRAAPTTSGEITIKDGQFLQDGRPVFLLGLSYFDGLSAPPRILESDLRYFSERGFNALRVWANWYTDFQPHTTGLLEPDGTVNVAILNRLKRLIETADKKGFVIKLTFSRHPLEKIPFPKYKNGILTVVREIRNSPNVVLDLQNETDHCGSNSDPDCSGHLTLSQAGELRDVVKEVDPGRLVTVSGGGGGADDYKSFVGRAKVDFIATHGPSRKKDWAEETSEEMDEARKQIGPEIPVLFDEPSRCDKGVDCKDPSAAKQFLTAAQNAKRAGAAGWFFHSSAGFRLNNRPMHERLNRTERIVANRLEEAIK